MSGRIRSAKAVISDWKVSHTTRNGILYCAVFALVGQHAPHLARVHAGVPGHVGHEQHQRVDRVGVAAPGIGDHVVHQPVGRQRVFPRETLVDAHRLAGRVHEQVLGRLEPAQRRAVQRRVRLDGLGALGRPGVGRHGARIGRLVPEAAGPVDGAQQRHQDGQRADGLEAVAVRRQATHRVEGDRVAGHALVLAAPPVGPGDGQLDGLVARGHAHLVRQAADRRRGNAGDVLGPLGRATAHALFQQLERGLDRRAVGHGEAAEQRRVRALGVVGHRLAGDAVPPPEVVRPQRVDDVALGVAHHQAELVRRPRPGSPAGRRCCSAPGTRGRTGPARSARG